MQARLALEPTLARLAAVRGTPADLEPVDELCGRCRDALDWRAYEAADDALHHAIAHATHNKVLVDLPDRLNMVRRATVWHQRRTTGRPPRDQPSFEQHDRIARALAAHDSEVAEVEIRQHLESARERVLSALLA